MQRLKWGGPKFDFGFKWINNDPSTVYYLCENPNCKAHIPEEEKHFMLSHCQFVKQNPNVKNKPGFYVPRLYSSSSPWGGWVEEFLIAKSKVKEGDKTKLQVFINTTLAELWDPTYGLPEEEELLQRVETYYSGEHPTLPEKICTLTAFTDVQDSYLETLIIGWGIGEESWRIERHIMPGNPGQHYVWNELDILLQKPFTHSLGVPLFISAAGIDTGGHFTDEAYSFVKNKAHRRIYGTKGANVPGKPIAPKQPSMNNKGGIPLYIIGTDTAKEVVFGRLKIEKKNDWKDDEVHPGFPHFNHFCDADYFEQLTGEKQVMRKIQGLHVPVWEEIPNRRHEVLDCEVGNLAVLRISKQNLIKIAEDLKSKATQLKQGTLFDQPKTETKQQQPLIKKNWTNNW
jgi:phage terminase large subunit GpA-like protein